jgi:hypothetical protein
MPIVAFADLPEPNDVTYAEGRLTTRTYASKSFTAAFGQDQGHPSRYIYRVFDEVVTDDDDGWEWTNDVVFTTPGGRKQLQLQVARDFAHQRVAAEQPMPGVIVVPTPMPIGVAIAELAMVAAASDPEEWAGRVVYLPLR